MLLTQTPWVWPPYPPFTNYMSLSNLLNFCALQFPQSNMGTIIIPTLWDSCVL